MDAANADLQTDTPDPAKEDVQDKTSETSAAPRLLEDSSVPLVTAGSAVVRLLADIEPTPAAGIAAVAVIIILSLFGRVGSLVIGLLVGLLLHAAIERRRDTIQWHPHAQLPSDSSAVPVREVPSPSFQS
jgi:hypothetical protein